MHYQFSLTEIVVIVLIVVLIFGARLLPHLAGFLRIGQAARLSETQQIGWLIAIIAILTLANLGVWLT